MVTARKLLDLIADFVDERGSTADDTSLQDIAQRFDVALSEAIGDRASMQTEA